MKALPILVLAILWPLCVVSQNPATGQVKGRVLDEDLKTGLTGATIALVHAKDSTPTTYSAMTGEKGGFTISGVGQGSYKAYVTYLGYQPQLLPKDILVSSGPIDLGDISLKKKTIQLKEIEISETRAPFVMRKDTMEFRADYYKTRETSPLEALLKKLPGLEISPDGGIKYNGKVVEAILIDGRPFFGNDIKKATKNLLSGLIETVQVIDRESNNPDHSLSNSSNQEKVINLTLKQSVYGKLNGIIGANGGTDGKYKFNVNLNKFDHKSQISLISGGDNVSIFEPDGPIPENVFSFWKAGVNYNTDINSKMRIGGSYSYDNVDQDAESSSSRQNIFSDSVSNYQQTQSAKSKTSIHYVNLNFNYEIDSLTNLSFSSNVGLTSLHSLTNTSYFTNSENQKVNDGSLVQSNTGDKYAIISNLSLNHKFRKVGRKVRLAVNYFSFRESSQIESANTTRYFFRADSVQTNNLRQYSYNKDQRSETSFNLEYSEPLSKGISLNLFYNFSSVFTPVTKKTFDFNTVTGKNDLLNDSLSGIIKNSNYLHNAGFILKIEKEKFAFEIGSNLIANDQIASSTLETRKYSNTTLKLFPLITFEYNFNSRSKFNFDYARKLQPPSVQQLFIIPNIYNPLFIQRGNNSLTPSISDNLNISYQSIDPLTSRTFSVVGNLAFTKDQIVSTMNYDTLGRMISFPVNLNGFSNGTLYIINGFAIKHINSTLSTTTSFNWSKDVNIINQITTKASRAVIGQFVNYNFHYKDLIDLSTTLSATYNFVRYPSSRDLNTTYSDYLLMLSSSFTLPGKIILAPNVNYRVLSGRTAGFNNTRLILNCVVSRAFLKSQALVIKGQVFDLLNQNNATVRNIGPGFIEDSESNALKRFLMIGVVYNIK